MLLERIKPHLLKKHLLLLSTNGSLRYVSHVQGQERRSRKYANIFTISIIRAWYVVYHGIKCIGILSF